MLHPTMVQVMLVVAIIIFVRCVPLWGCNRCYLYFVTAKIILDRVVAGYLLSSCGVSTGTF